MQFVLVQAFWGTCIRYVPTTQLLFTLCYLSVWRREWQPNAVEQDFLLLLSNPSSQLVDTQIPGVGVHLLMSVFLCRA